MAKITGGISLDAGIVEILSRGDQPLQGLPDERANLPGKAGFTARLREVLFPPSVEQGLVGGLRPEVSDRSMLSPSGFTKVLQDTQQALLKELDSRPDGPEKDLIEQALQQLEVNEQLRSLLGTYRHILQRA